MSTYTFIGVSFYPFPYEHELLDEQAAHLARQFSSGTVVPVSPVLPLFESRVTPGALEEGGRFLWRASHAGMVYRWGDTACLIGLYAPFPSQEGPGSPVPPRQSEGWKAWFASPRWLPPALL